MADKDQNSHDEREHDEVNSLWYGNNATDYPREEDSDEAVDELFEDPLDSASDDEDYKEEYAADAAVDRSLVDNVRDDDADETEGVGLGWLALVLSVIGLFFLPIIMGAAGIIVGIIARRQGARTLGAWAIGVGIAAIVILLFTAPFF
ncbi:hypothetical protein GCM10011391_27250 [Pullulanibacillus camelliae]|uniref:DUF4190 domain-containing protein n=1 Tax=Pullulanibacillus camelliae TaxID=1707096 RepID=A0A8J3DWQ3_9BACL|nr:DUF4190 domain-containing protein [Pullulanibacillus camelliae]GGE46987.1 hypothetical protein GCM10011391_27250 [Pullulanibacillus camelliae]